MNIKVIVYFLIFCIFELQTLLQSSSRLVRTSTLSFASSLSARIPLYTIADNILSLIENRPQHRDCGFKIVSISLLCLVKQAVCTSISDSHKRLLKDYVIRLANCAAIEVQVDAPAHQQDGNYTEEAKSAITHAAMDLLAIACIASGELEKSFLQMPTAAPQAALRSLLSSLCALQAAEVQLDNGTEREICRRSKSLDFPSLAEESIFPVVKSLISVIQSPDTVANISNLVLDSLTKKDSAISDKLSVSGKNSSLSEMLVESDGSPTSSNKHIARRSIARIRKSWSTSADKIVSTSAGAGFGDDTDAADVSNIMAHFSPPKLTAARSFNGSPTVSAPAAFGEKGSNSGLLSGTKLVETSKSAYMPSWSAGKTHAERDRTEQLTRGRAHFAGRKVVDAAVEENDPFPKMLETQSGRYASASDATLVSSSLQSHSSSMQSLGLSIRDPFVSSSGRSQLSGEPFDEEHPIDSPTSSSAQQQQQQQPQQQGMERMGRSLRLLKSPHSRHPHPHPHLPSAESDQGHPSSFAKCVSESIDENTHSYFVEDPHELNSASNESFSPFVPSGRRGPSTSSDGDGEGVGEDQGFSASQSFDSASKARLKRTRLKSANAMAASYDAAESEDFSGLSGGRMTSPRMPTGRGHRHVVSKSETGLDKRLSGDDRPIGGAHQRAMSHGFNFSSEDLQCDGQEDYTPQAAKTDYGAPYPAKQHVAARRSKAQKSSELAESPVQMNLNDVTSQILKPDNTYDYIPSEEITACLNPAQEMNRAYKGLETQDWPEIFHTLNTFRKLALHHPTVLVSAGTLHNVVLLIMKRVDALRSSLAKNALLTIIDMFKGIGKHMDAEVATMVPGILKVQFYLIFSPQV